MDESKKVGDLTFDLKLIQAPFLVDEINESLADKMLPCSFKFYLSKRRKKEKIESIKGNLICVVFREQVFVNRYL